jgi:hypothetical protein
VAAALHWNARSLSLWCLFPHTFDRVVRNP